MDYLKKQEIKKGRGRERETERRGRVGKKKEEEREDYLKYIKKKSNIHLILILNGIFLYYRNSWKITT